MWLRDALPYDVTEESGDNRPVSRVMVYGCSSNLFQSDSFQNLEDLGTAFHRHLRKLAIAGAFKPIVFIAHSLGGLIVKQVFALAMIIYTVFSRYTRPLYHSISPKTRKIKNYYERYTESPFLVFHMTAWTLVPSFLWLKTGRTDFYWNLLDSLAHRS